MTGIVDAVALPRHSTAQWNSRAALWGVVAAFLVRGLIVSTWVSRIPSIKKSLHIGDGALGIALLGSAVGSLVAIPLCGWAVTRYGGRRAVLSTACGFAASLLMLALAPNLASLAVSLVLYGAMSGANDVAINAHGIAVEKRLGNSAMNRFHAMFSLGAIAGSSAGALMASLGIIPVLHFAIAALAIVAGVASVNHLIPDFRDDAPVAVKPVRNARSSAVLILSAVGFCIFLTEGAIADWTSVFISQVLHASDGVAAAGYAVFAAFMTIFRLTGDAISTRLGHARTIRSGALLAAAGLLIVASAGSSAPAFAGLALAGAGLSCIIPLVFAAAGRVSAASEAAGIATVSGIGYLAFFVGPPAIGFVSELWSLRAGFAVLVSLSALAAFLAAVLERVTRSARTADQTPPFQTSPSRSS